jgi:hypothetical protein
MGARLDKARILLNLASPRQRGLKLKEIVNKNNDRQKVWVRDVKRSSQVKQTTQKVEKALSFRSPKYAPEGTLKRLGLSTEIDLYSDITEGYEIARPYIKDEARVKELRHGLDSISEKVYKLEKKKKNVNEEIAMAKDYIYMALYDDYDIDLLSESGDYDSIEDVPHKDFLDVARKAFSTVGVEASKSEDRSVQWRYEALTTEMETLEDGIELLPEIKVERNQRLDEIDAIYEEAKPLLDHKGLMGEISKQCGMSQAEAEKALSRIDLSEVEQSGYPRKTIAAWVKEGLMLIGNKVDIKKVSVDGDSNAGPYHKEGFISLSGLGKLAKTDEEAKTILLHEIAHGIEDKKPEVAKMNSDWVYRRKKDFFDSYVGTLYTENNGANVRATEVTSTGMEMISNHKDAVHLLLRDPEHFAITLKGLKM